MTGRTSILAALLVAGCTVGPDYKPPVAEIPAAFVGPQPVGTDVDPAHWWTAYQDPLLSSLVERSLTGNPDIATAASRVREARSQETAARTAGLPTVDASADVTQLRFSKNAGFSSLASRFGGGGAGGSGTGSGAGSGAGGGSGSSGGLAGPGDSIRTYGLGFDASWEIDLFGGVRRGVEAARARTDAAIWNQRDAAVTLTAEVARVYFALRLDQAQIGVLEQEIARQQRALELAGTIAEAGLTAQVDVTRQRASARAALARLQPLRSDLEVQAHALDILLGKPPGTLTAELKPLPAMTAAAPAIPAGLPSDLLRRRPDIRAAERALAAASADIGVAVADLYPRFSLTGAAQLLSTALGNLFSGDSLQLTATGSAMFPVVDFGRRRAEVTARKERREQAYQAYRTTVLGALRDVEDALARLAAERQRNVVLRETVTDRLATARAVEAQYRGGLVAQDSLLNAQAEVLVARENLTASDAQLRQQDAALFKAIGGGWEAAEQTEEGKRR